MDVHRGGNSTETHLSSLLWTQDEELPRSSEALYWGSCQTRKIKTISAKQVLFVGEAKLLSPAPTIFRRSNYASLLCKLMETVQPSSFASVFGPCLKQIHIPTNHRSCYKSEILLILSGLLFFLCFFTNINGER